MKLKDTCYIFSYGGLGEFLFQLDFAKRLELSGDFKIILVTRKNYTLFNELIHGSNLQETKLVSAPGIHFYIKGTSIVYRAFFNSVWVVNAFDVKHYRLMSLGLYNVLALFGGRVLLYAKDRRLLSKNIYYIPRDEKEMIWKRNVRANQIISSNLPVEAKNFPVLSFQVKPPLKKNYIHIHPVASIRERSYPPKKLIELVKLLTVNQDVLITYTPKEREWYLSSSEMEELASIPRVQIICQFLKPDVLMGYIKSSDVFCTMDTGLLWMALFLQKETVCFDIFTDYEWNPEPYGDTVIRLCHEYDESGASLFKKKREYEDGTFFESMYLITPQEAYGAVKNLSKK